MQWRKSSANVVKSCRNTRSGETRSRATDHVCQCALPWRVELPYTSAPTRSAPNALGGSAAQRRLPNPPFASLHARPLAHPSRAIRRPTPRPRSFWPPTAHMRARGECRPPGVARDGLAHTEQHAWTLDIGCRRRNVRTWSASVSGGYRVDSVILAALHVHRRVLLGARCSDTPSHYRRARGFRCGEHEECDVRRAASLACH